MSEVTELVNEGIDEVEDEGVWVLADERGMMSMMRSPSTRMSAGKAGFPVPSMTIPFLINVFIFFQLIFICLSAYSETPVLGNAGPWKRRSLETPIV